MCGTVGYIGQQQASQILFDGLTRLEYRGYDSAGLVTLSENQFQRSRAAGKLQQLKQQLNLEPLFGTVGIGHTRWATHGKPSEINAHPHIAGRIALVHNGIIENYLSLRKELEAKGRKFTSETDSEVIAHLLDETLSSTTNIRQALHHVLQQLRGSYAFVALDQKNPDCLYFARHQSPLVLGLGEHENFIASDVPALLPYTKKVIFLEDGDFGFVYARSIQILSRQLETIERPIQEIQWTLAQAEKGGFKHFMQKEIFEIPRAFVDTLRGSVLPSNSQILLDDFLSQIKVRDIQRIYLIACGTSYHAALIAKFYFERWVKIPVMVEVASEFRYSYPLLDSKTLLISISQSGETADTLMAVKSAKEKGVFCYSICNVVGASIPRISHEVFYTHAGPEIGVAATKTFVTQIEALLLIALAWGKERSTLSVEEYQSVLDAVVLLPLQMERVLRQAELIQQMSAHFTKSKYFLFIGRGVQYPIALEAALKLKEISYITSEGYPAGELKHGPIAMIEPGTPVVVLCPQDGLEEKTYSNLQEVLARSATVIAITNEGSGLELPQNVSQLSVPQTHPLLYPFLTVLPLQLFAYEIANTKGHDVDQPRNLAKSVTVE